MRPNNNEIIEWVEAPDVRIALEGIPDTSNLYDLAVQERADLVRTAVGVTLLEHLEKAQQEVLLVTSGLEKLGVIKEENALEAIDETKVLITEENFREVAQKKDNWRYYSRPWFLLGRTFPELFPDPSDKGKGIPLASLRELLESGTLNDTRNFGPASIHLVRGVIELMSPGNIVK